MLRWLALLAWLAPVLNQDFPQGEDAVDLRLYREKGFWSGDKSAAVDKSADDKSGATYDDTTTNKNPPDVRGAPDAQFSEKEAAKDDAPYAADDDDEPPPLSAAAADAPTRDPADVDDDVLRAVVAVWGRGGKGPRCTGVFIAPEAVLTSCACVLSAEPEGTPLHAACANGAAECPTLPPSALELLAPGALPAREVVADVQAIEFRYSDPAAMPHVCSGGAVCGEGWDIAVLRVRQRCPQQRCVRPLRVSLAPPAAGAPVRLASVAPRAAPASGWRLRLVSLSVQTVVSHQALMLAPTTHAADGRPPAGGDDEAAAAPAAAPLPSLTCASAARATRAGRCSWSGRRPTSPAGGRSRASHADGGRSGRWSECTRAW